MILESLFSSIQDLASSAVSGDFPSVILLLSILSLLVFLLLWGIVGLRFLAWKRSQRKKRSTYKVKVRRVGKGDKA